MEMARTAQDFARSTIIANPAPLLRLFKTFDDAILNWSLLRPWQALSCEFGDIDILLDPSKLATAKRIAGNEGFLIMPNGGPDIHAATFDPASGRFLWIHMQSELKAAGISIPARLVPNQIRGPFPEIASNWMLLTLLARCLDKGEVPERYRERLSELAGEWCGGPPELESAMRAQGVNPEEAVAAAAVADWSHLLSLELARDKRTGPAPPPASRFLRRIWRFVLGSLTPQRQGVCVAIIGPDGAGKSTLVAGLERTLPLPTRTIYMGLTGGDMRRAIKLRIPGLVFAAQVAVLWVRFGRGILHRTSGRIVLFERYVLDGAVPPGRPMSLARLFARRVQRWSVPMPDLVLLLDASGRTMYERKGEYTPEILEEVRSCYRKVGARVVNLAVIDAETPAEEVLRTAQDLIWQGLRHRRRG